MAESGHALEQDRRDSASGDEAVAVAAARLASDGRGRGCVRRGGGFYNGLWTAVKWSVEELTELDIMELEALMYVIFLKMLIDRDPAIVSGRRFVARNDNQPWVAAANSNDSSKPAIAVLLGWLHELMVYYSFDVGLEWIASKANPIADALSRGARALFLRSALDAGFAPSALVRVQMPTRSSIVSAMISAKRSARSMQQAQ